MAAPPPGFDPTASVLPDPGASSAPIHVMRGGGMKGGATDEELLRAYQLAEGQPLASEFSEEDKQKFLEALKLEGCNWTTKSVLNAKCAPVVNVLKALLKQQIKTANSRDIPEGIKVNSNSAKQFVTALGEMVKKSRTAEKAVPAVVPIDPAAPVEKASTMSATSVPFWKRFARPTPASSAAGTGLLSSNSGSELEGPGVMSNEDRAASNAPNATNLTAVRAASAARAASAERAAGAARPASAVDAGSELDVVVSRLRPVNFAGNETGSGIRLQYNTKKNKYRANFKHGLKFASAYGNTPERAVNTMKNYQQRYEESEASRKANIAASQAVAKNLRNQERALAERRRAAQKAASSKKTFAEKLQFWKGGRRTRKGSRKSRRTSRKNRRNTRKGNRK